VVRYFFIFLLSLSFFSTGISAVPVITNISPAVGPSAGGTTVNISGSGFLGTTVVDFGNRVASFIVNSDSSITAMTPPHAPQVVTVFVTSTSGTSTPNNNSFFTFQGDWQAYIVNNGSSEVTVIDVPTNTITTTIPVEANPTPIDLLPDGSLVFVANRADGSISVIDTATNTVINTIPPLSGLHFDIATLDMQPNGAMNYAPLFESQALAVIDNATQTQITNIPVGPEATNMAITPDGTQAYVCNEENSTVSVINLSTNTVTTTLLVGFEPIAAVTTPDGKQVYIVNAASGTVSVFDTSTNMLTATISVGVAPFGIAITPDGTQAYVANIFSNDVSVIDTTTNTVTTTIPVILEPDLISITPDGTKAYVMELAFGTVSVIDTATNTVITGILVGTFPQAQVISPDGGKVFVANTFDNTVSVIDTTINTVIATIPVGSEPAAIGITADQAPLAQFTMNVQPFGQPTIFDASGSNSPTGTIANYFWNFGDGTTVNTPNPVISHVYGKPGTYKVTLIVTNTAGTSLDQIFYFSSSNNNFANTASPVTNNNGGPTAMRTNTVTLNFFPPTNFIGCLKINKFLNRSDYFVKATFAASPSPGVVAYRVFDHGVLFKEIPATAPLSFQICLNSMDAVRGLTVAAVGPGGVLSAPVRITITGSCCH
jgi:YVTN family beta-propeller protein